MFISKNQNRTLQQREARCFGRDITNMPKLSLNCKKLPTFEHKQLLKEQPQTIDPINDYIKDIKKYLNEKGQSFQTKMIEEQATEVTPKMKQILIDWLVDVHQSFELKDQTLHLAILYLQDYQQLRPIRKEDYQLIGITCLWIASKYQEIYPPQMKHYVQVTAFTYTAAQIKKTQGEILKALDFQLVKVTPLAILAAQKHSHAKTEALAKYLLELGYLQGSIFGNYGARLMATAAIRLSERIYSTSSNLSELCQNLQPQTIQKCQKELCLLLQVQNKYKLTALKRKFMKEKYLGVGKLKVQP